MSPMSEIRPEQIPATLMQPAMDAGYPAEHECPRQGDRGRDGADIMTVTEELIAFYMARLDEEEAAANAGARRVGMPWRAEPQPGTPGGLVIDELGLVCVTGGRYAAEHIARHDPGRVLLGIEADRAILALHEQHRPFRLPEEVRAREALEDVIRIWAARFRKHPDYKQEWVPHPY